MYGINCLRLALDDTGETADDEHNDIDGMDELDVIAAGIREISILRGSGIFINGKGKGTICDDVLKCLIMVSNFGFSLL